MSAPTVNKTFYPKVRRIVFPFGQSAPIDKYFMKGNIPFSHLIAQLSFAFPPGEEFFIRSVRRYSHLIADPVLKKRVAGFIGQEAVHGLQHRDLNDKLVEMGYVGRDRVENQFKTIEERENRLDAQWPVAEHPEKYRLTRFAMLAATATAEHGTAVLAERVLAIPESQALMADSEVKNLLNWHAFEELEHKSVAADVYRAAGGPEWLRVFIARYFAATNLPLLFLVTLGSIIATDRAALLRPIRLVKDFVEMFQSPVLKGTTKALKVAGRRGFHPDDIDTTSLLDKWNAELFGDNGALLDHLK
ncbi:metal-dependent hydrolase [Segniliparus rugosus]|uniref:Metal-dependent hydrolase n=1 Tax=Segniliparus rugosus (strain ATCC BAA-974 / DSM 45345 / CCUG 50838 / CIP 108380 / JCM 13579 / CDC 945) TaxID=679197 RepID=E5XP05_SEGRC|nr:metal-dependent hydrolase [Segniliparus rugosus]EFV13897.1 hypothetical protein HMPREF9336_01226 [Segniliparus rugosus ATCC BAA-974]